MYINAYARVGVQTVRNEFDELCLSYLAWGRINSNNLGLSLTSRTYFIINLAWKRILQRASVF